MNDLLREALGAVFIYAFKAQSFHWNVRGMFFKPLHELFGDVYEDAVGSVDRLAEYLRIEGELAPASLAEVYTYTSLTEQHAVPGTAAEMLSVLAQDTMAVIEVLNKLMNAAEVAKAHGIVDFVGERIDAHKKFHWMLSAHLAQ